MTSDAAGASRRILVVWNPKAGSKAGLPTNLAGESDVRAAMERHGLGDELYRSESTEDTRERIDAAIRDDYDVIVAAGGDGTAYGIADAILGRERPVLGLLPLGSAMNLARAVGIPRDLDQAAAIIEAGHVRAIDVGVIGGKPFHEIVSIGLSAEAFDHAQEVDRKHRWRAILEFIRLAARYRRTRVELELDGRVIRRRARALAIANGPDTGMGVRLAPDATVDDGRLDVIVYEGLSPSGLVLTLFRGLAGGDRASTFHVAHAAHVRVATHRPLAVRADARDAGRTPVELSIRPRALRILAPMPESADPGEQETG
jgi:YegS/Rv2252/BmrU family lipid kinase